MSNTSFPVAVLVLSAFSSSVAANNYSCEAGGSNDATLQIGGVDSCEPTAKASEPLAEIILQPAETTTCPAIEVEGIGVSLSVEFTFTQSDMEKVQAAVGAGVDGFCGTNTAAKIQNELNRGDKITVEEQFYRPGDFTITVNVEQDESGIGVISENVISLHTGDTQFVTGSGRLVPTNP